MSFKIAVIKDKILSENYFVLRNITYDLTRKNGEVIRHKREVYDRGNGATILLYNRSKNTVVLIRQFRVATWVNGNADGRLIETCAGLLDDDEPEICIRKEAIEETGYRVGEVRKVFELYMSPGGVTEIVHFFIAEYDDSLRANAGGGVEDEDIEVLEIPFTSALEMIASGEIRDGKAVILLQYLQTSGLMQALFPARQLFMSAIR
ncbi:GDP-mannose pyrophosphatase NudK [Superficieibacter sp.]|uniref:GDP-mannose pyrophosphatase NudK n=1 Tax=Superficieibacter sp. TaxID=2303322 RepID=UPI0028B08E76|nr:GDP-mannose pyrophosphatase NudK [Superficieibacter sp.]